jgi:GNAT superfamily N-acetyltransferase
MSESFPALQPRCAGYQTWEAEPAAGLSALMTTDPQAPALDTFYTAYDAAFVLPSEKEDLEGFRDCLALNGGAAYTRLEKRYGPYRELVILLSLADGAVIGGANFIALGGPAAITVNLNYIFIARDARGAGHFRRLMALVEREARAAFVTPASFPVLIFIEQNDPLRLDPESYALDSAHSGLDQYDRLRIWRHLGARLVDLDYLQPALSAGQEPDTGLLYGVLGASGNSLPACLLARHLRQFFGISVLKGRKIEDDADALRQVSALDARCQRGERIALIDPGAALAQGAPGRTDQSFLDLARRAAASATSQR